MNLTCFAFQLGSVGYTEAWELQKRLHASVASGELPGVLLLLEHPHVYTLGRRGKADDVLIDPDRLQEVGAEVHFIDRGGEATYHGPGQLVGYPILNLRKLRIDPRRYVESLERAIILTLADYGIEGVSEGRPTGVWVGDAKIAAIGVRISSHTTMHGFALNVDPDLSYFDNIVPCGLPGSAVTSIANLTGASASVEETALRLSAHLAAELGLQLFWCEPEELQLHTEKPGAI